LKFSDLSINSMLCAVALSSSISRTRMPIPLALVRAWTRCRAAAQKPVTPDSPRYSRLVNKL
jgi:hypothetical protein